MPFAAKHLCLGGCGQPVSIGYCQTCKAKGAARERRASSAKRGYGYRWQQYREIVLSARPLCIDPARRHVGVVKLASDLDHAKAVRGPDDPLFWEPTNHQPLCHECHSHKTATEDGGFGR